jgi:hypothetical protein
VRVSRGALLDALVYVVNGELVYCDESGELRWAREPDSPFPLNTIGRLEGATWVGGQES